MLIRCQNRVMCIPSSLYRNKSKAAAVEAVTANVFQRIQYRFLNRVERAKLENLIKNQVLEQYESA